MTDSPEIITTARRFYELRRFWLSKRWDRLSPELQERYLDMAREALYRSVSVLV